MAEPTKHPHGNHVDAVKRVPDSLFKAQLMDTSDIVGSLTLAPPTKKLMRFRQKQEADDLFETPGRPHHSCQISNAFRRNVPGGQGSPHAAGYKQVKKFKKPAVIRSKFDQSGNRTASVGNYPVLLKQPSTELQQATQSIVTEVQHNETPSEGNVVVLVSDEMDGMFPSSVIEQLQNQQHAIAFQQQHGDTGNVQTVFVNVSELEVQVPTAAAGLFQGDEQVQIITSASATQLIQNSVTQSITSVEMKKEDSGLPSNVMEEESMSRQEQTNQTIIADAATLQTVTSLPGNTEQSNQMIITGGPTILQTVTSLPGTTLTVDSIPSTAVIVNTAPTETVAVTAASDSNATVINSTGVSESNEVKTSESRQEDPQQTAK